MSTTAASTTEAPTTLADTADLLRDTSGSVLVRGGATKLDWAGRVETPDLLLDTTRLSGVLTHNPADLTASVRAGTTLTQFQQELAGAGQWLALDPATEAVGATVGGLLAAGDSGPSRLRYGGLRDLVIGVTLVLADGTVARSGGHVIKNVAGYDLAKLVYGSLGSLAVVAEVVVRLHPRLAASVTVAGPASSNQAAAAALALMASPLEPTAVEWVSGESNGRLLVRTDGTADFVAAAGQRVSDLLIAGGVAAASLSEEDAAAAWHEQAEAVRGAEEETLVRVSARPSDIAEVFEFSARRAEDAGLEVRLVASGALGLGTVALRGGEPAQHGCVLTDVRGAVRDRGGSVLLRHRADAVEEHVDALGPEPSTVTLLRRIKAQFDPDGRLAPGRFRPWY